jgi:hypothetical protein
MAIRAKGIQEDLDIHKTFIDTAIGARKLLTKTIKLCKTLAQFNMELGINLVPPVLCVFVSS